MCVLLPRPSLVTTWYVCCLTSCCDLPCNSTLLWLLCTQAVMRLDGLDPLVMWGTGGATGHSTIAVRDPKDGELYVCESTAANPFGVVRKRVWWHDH